MFLKTTFFFNCQDFLDATVYTFKNDTMLRAWLFIYKKLCLAEKID